MHPLAVALRTGGDARLRLPPGQLFDSYGCRAVPEKHLSYSSCTASTISGDAWHYLNQVQARIDAFPSESENSIRKRILEYIGCSDVDVALGPSGTDMELLVLYLGLLRSSQLSNILIGPEEVGSGITDAAGGCYFSEITANGYAVNKGGVVSGFEIYDIDVCCLPVRDPVDGSVLGSSNVKDAIHRRIKADLKAARRTILHMVYRTKTGLVVPDVKTIMAIRSAYPDAVDIVVDCCQLRMSPAELKALLDAGVMVIITGSKFLGGPPFSSALLIPSNLAARFTWGGVPPEGLAEFFTRGALPASWSHFDGALPIASNPGLLLRWEAALFELERFAELPENELVETAHLFHGAFQILAEQSRVLHDISPYPASSRSTSYYDLTIKTFELNHPSVSMDISHAYEIYRDLYTILHPDDISISEYERSCMSTICHLGQPVRVRQHSDGRWVATLRIALSAKDFVRLAGLSTQQKTRIFHSELGVIMSKLSMLVQGVKA